MSKFFKIESIINEWDPIDLLSFFPNDEYEDEIREVIDLLEQCNNDIYSIANGISRIFTNAFPEGIFSKDIDDCLQIAKQIVNLNDKNQ